jgi:two-component system NtrC family sensor kinase
LQARHIVLFFNWVYCVLGAGFLRRNRHALKGGHLFDRAVKAYNEAIYGTDRERALKVVHDAVDTLVTRAVETCRIPENIDLRVHVPDSLPLLHVDPFQMGRVFRNLIGNAVQTMPERGMPTVGARWVEEIGGRGSGVRHSNSRFPIQDSQFKADWVEISISGTGEGTAHENMEKLFQPLFTTKTKGMGLGLTMCRNLTEANGGRIEVESSPGAGSAFTVILPGR